MWSGTCRRGRQRPRPRLRHGRGTAAAAARSPDLTVDALHVELVCAKSLDFVCLLGHPLSGSAGLGFSFSSWFGWSQNCMLVKAVCWNRCFSIALVLVWRTKLAQCG
jgi:hypothetical protein